MIATHSGVFNVLVYTPPNLQSFTTEEEKE